MRDYKLQNSRVKNESSAMWQSITFNTRMEDAEAEPVKVVIYGREVIDIEVHQRPTFLNSIALLVVHA